MKHLEGGFGKIWIWILTFLLIRKLIKIFSLHSGIQRQFSWYLPWLLFLLYLFCKCWWSLGLSLRPSSFTLHILSPNKIVSSFSWLQLLSTCHQCPNPYGIVGKAIFWRSTVKDIFTSKASLLDHLHSICLKWPHQFSPRNTLLLRVPSLQRPQGVIVDHPLCCYPCTH